MSEPSDKPEPHQQKVAASKPSLWWSIIIGWCVLSFALFGLSIFFNALTTLAMGSLFLLIGTVILSAAIGMFAEALRFTRIARSTIGVVVGFEERPEEQDESEGKYSISVGSFSWSFGKPAKRVLYFPRLEFETEDHEKQVFTSDDGSKKPPYHVGQSVPVMYDPARPQVAKIEESPWGGLVLGVLFGSLFLLPGLWLLLRVADSLLIAFTGNEL